MTATMSDKAIRNPFVVAWLTRYWVLLYVPLFIMAAVTDRSPEPLLGSMPWRVTFIGAALASIDLMERPRNVRARYVAMFLAEVACFSRATSLLFLAAHADVLAFASWTVIALSYATLLTGSWWMAEHQR